jgi:hypothetical protein
MSEPMSEAEKFLSTANKQLREENTTLSTQCAAMRECLDDCHKWITGLHLDTDSKIGIWTQIEKVLDGTAGRDLLERIAKQDERIKELSEDAFLYRAGESCFRGRAISHTIEIMKRIANGERVHSRNGTDDTHYDHVSVEFAQAALKTADELGIMQ